LIHPEFANQFLAKLIIENDRVPLRIRAVPTVGADLLNFVPFPKNPIIAKFFKEIGWWMNWDPA
jgi:ATP-dependent DNA helicase RecG